MNKKYISLLLAGLMCFSSVVPVFAYDLDSSGNSIENIEYQNTDDEDYTNATNVFAELGSEYKVTIPKTIVLSGVTKSAEYKVSVSGDIAGCETIFVTPDSNVKLYSKNKNLQLGTITQDKIGWTYSTIDEVGNGMITANSLTAGKWSGVFDFNISFNRVLGDVIDPEHMHNAGDAQIENLVQPDCETPGSYDEVFYCVDCFTEISRESKIIPATGHDYKLIEKTDANCTLNSTEKYQCSTCLKEMETHDDAACHKPANAVRENEVASTCAKEGSYDEVIYCADCGKELKRTTKTIDKLAHKPASTVRENEVASTCAKEGSYDEVIYCADCGEEISRTAKTINKLTHKPANAVRENEVAITYTTNGSYDEVTYCADCGKELSRVKKTVDRFEVGGLFDANNNLIKSWDELVELGLDVEKEYDSISSKSSYYKSVPSSGYSVFTNNNLSGKLIIPDSVTSIGNNTFRECPNLISVTIPNSVTSIGSYAFNKCASLTSITIPDSVTSIETYTFNECTNLTSVTIPDSVITIGWGAFRRTGLTSVTIPASVTSIGNSAFVRCTNLTSVTIPASVTSIGMQAFQECKSLTSITYNGTKAQWNAIQKSNTWATMDNITINCTDGTLQVIG